MNNTTEKKFTPGPWEARGNKIFIPGKTKSIATIHIQRLESTEAWIKNPIDEERDANIELIASAPTLYAENIQLKQQLEESLLLYNSMVKNIEKLQEDNKRVWGIARMYRLRLNLMRKGGEETVLENLQLKQTIIELQGELKEAQQSKEQLQRRINGMIPTSPMDTDPALVSRINAMTFDNINRTTVEGVLLSNTIAILCFIYKKWRNKKPELVFRVVKDIFLNPFLVETPDETMEKVEIEFKKDNN